MQAFRRSDKFNGKYCLISLCLLLEFDWLPESIAQHKPLLIGVRLVLIYVCYNKIIVCQLLLASTSPKILLECGSWKAWNGCLGVSDVFPSAS